MDPLVAAVATVIGNFAIDQGSKIVSSFGEVAGQVAQRIYKTVLDKLKSDPTVAKTADGYQQNPAGYQTAVTDALAEAVKSDPAFEAALRGLIQEYEASAPGAQQSIRNVTGGVSVGDHNVQVNNPTGPVNIGRTDPEGPG